MKRVMYTICRVVGAPYPMEIERKFLLKNLPVNIPVPYEEVEIEQTYLKTGDGSSTRVRRRRQRGSSVYTHTIKYPIADGQRIETERQISAREYITLLADADPEKIPIKKRRRCFLWQSQYFELDIFEEPFGGLVMMELELNDPDQEIQLPPFVDIDREVTSEGRFQNSELANKGS